MKHIPEYVEHIETTHQPLYLKNFRCDSGEQYVSDAMSSFFRLQGISQQLTAPYTLEQNGKRERLNQVIFQIAGTILKFGGMPDEYWAEAVLYAVYVKNRMLDKNGITRCEKWTGRRPNVAHVCTCGCKAFAFRPSEMRKKLEDKARVCVLLGYANDTDSSTDYSIYAPIVSLQLPTSPSMRIPSIKT